MKRSTLLFVLLALAVASWSPFPPRAALAAMSPAAGRAATPATSPAVTRAMDDMVAELLGGGPGGAGGSKGVAPHAGPVRFEGSAWQSGNGAAGTSAFGLQMDRAVTAALGAHHIEAQTGSSVGSKGIGGNILRGSFQLLKSGMSVSLSLVDANTGQVISQARRLMNTSSLAGIAADNLLPPGSGNARALAQLVTQSVGSGPSAFQVQVSTDRGPQGAYFENDPLQVSVRSERDCYLRLYHISWSDRTLTLIFPNQGDRESFLPAGTVKQVPSPGSTAQFVVSKPYGVDAIIAIASSQPFDDDAWVTSQLATAEPGSGMQGSPQQGASEPDPNASLGSRGVVRAGAYLATERTSEARARSILAKGLIVRQTGPPQPAGRRMESAGPGSTPLFQGGETPGAAPVPGQMPALASPAPGAIKGEVARASCYYTTLPSIGLRR